ncbi:crossover junction endodeoxyribonuclease RuvC [Patescibacteria group bacterium]
MRVLSIDPGYERVGIAIIEKEKNQKEKLIYSDCFKTSVKEPFYQRMLQIGDEIEKIIDQYSPNKIAIETLFFNTNQKTAMKVSETRGTIIYQALKKDLDVFEFTPLQIKTAITGYGRGDKNQVTAMVKNLIKIEKDIKYDDEFDAIAVGLTYFAYSSFK